MTTGKPIKPKPSYGQLPEDDKVAVNAIILSMMISGKPPIVVDAFQEGMDSVSSAKEKRTTSPEPGAPKAAGHTAESKKSRYAEGERILGELRNELAMQSIPKVTTVLGDLGKQTATFRFVLDHLAGSWKQDKNENVSEAVKKLAAANEARVFAEDASANPAVRVAIARFAASHSSVKTAGLSMSDCAAITPYLQKHDPVKALNSCQNR